MKKQLPTPTKENPFAQVDFIFQLVIDMKTNKNTKNSYRNACTYYKNFIKKTHNYNKHLKETGLFYLDIHWDEMTLVNFKKYIETINKKGTEAYRTTHTISVIFSAVRIVIKEAILNGYTSFSDLIDVGISNGVRETDINTAYSENELNQIKSALKEEIRFVIKIYNREGYKKTGIGADPRETKNGWGQIENMRWYFENVLDCQPIVCSEENKKTHLSFLQYGPSIIKNIKGLYDLYKIWGVTPLIDAEIIMPLVVQFAMVTGLNVQSIFELEVDCFEERNQISGVPALRYKKVRSGGEKEMHINTNVSNENIVLQEFRQKQVKNIQRIIKMILELTKEIRKIAPKELRNRLFIVQSSSNINYEKVMAVNNTVSSNWYRNFTKKYKLINDKGEKLAFNLQRFRTTKATELIQRGVDLFELKDEMGHKSVKVTMGYIDKNKLNKVALEETNLAIERIFKNKNWAEINKISYSQTEKDKFIYKGFLCDCRNPFNPPDDVKYLKEYQPGSICSRVNMCLFCDNVMIFKRNLPTLWMYKKQIEEVLDAKNAELPNEQFYKKTLNIIDALFRDEYSEFSDFDLEQAKMLAENMNELVDPVTYRANL